MKPTAPIQHLRILIVGAALSGSGYPNASHTTRLLSEQPWASVSDHACWLPANFHLWKLARGSARDKCQGLWLLGRRTLTSLYRLARHAHRHDVIYLPYPSLPLLWLLSWLPKRLRPACIADAYITLWDSLYQDRQLGKPRGFASRLLLRAESRALRAAKHILVDTQANASHLAVLFGVTRSRIRAFPLAVDQATLPNMPVDEAITNNYPAAPDPPIKVLFIGTFVPLQGTEVIARAIALLGDDPRLEFVLIGDGQQADRVAPLLAGQRRLTWLRGWQPPAVLAQHLANSDICLGVFGGEGKAARVLPFKLYLAMAAGKAIITQQHYSLPDQCIAPPLATCAAEPQALADVITALAADRQKRSALGQQGNAYYQQYLSAKALQQRWQQLLQ